MTVIQVRVPKVNTTPDNPHRGMHRWRNQNFAPIQTTVQYQRFLWKDLERDDGTIDLTKLDQFFASAALSGRRAAFRIQVVVTGDGSPKRGCPADIPVTICTDTNPDYNELHVPQWNSSVFLQRISRLLKAIGAKYNGDPRLAWVDIGVYGNWGEWHVSGFCGERATLESLKAIIDAHATAFSKSQLLMLTDYEPGFLYAMNKETLKPIGMRRDSWGQVHFDKISARPETMKFINERWKVAPFIIEAWPPIDFAVAARQIPQYHIASAGNGNLRLEWTSLTANQKTSWLAMHASMGYNYQLVGLSIDTEQKTIQQQWVNTGSCPSYDEWKIKYNFRRNGETIASVVTTLDLRKVIDATVHTESFDIAVPAGEYELVLQVEPVLSNLKAMTIANFPSGALGTHTIGEAQNPEETLIAKLQETVKQLQTELASTKASLETVQNTVITLNADKDSLAGQLHQVHTELTRVREAIKHLAASL